MCNSYIFEQKIIIDIVIIVVLLGVYWVVHFR